jgi:hypothetical protein
MNGRMLSPSWQRQLCRPTKNVSHGRRPAAEDRPFAESAPSCLRAIGCIDRSKFPKSFRRTLRQIPDQTQTKVRRTGLTAGGLRTEASEAILFAPRARPNRLAFVHPRSRANPWRTLVAGVRDCRWQILRGSNAAGNSGAILLTLVTLASSRKPSCRK